jgi:hypothetical protein
MHARRPSSSLMTRTGGAESIMTERSPRESPSRLNRDGMWALGVFLCIALANWIIYSLATEPLSALRQEVPVSAEAGQHGMQDVRGSSPQSFMRAKPQSNGSAEKVVRTARFVSTRRLGSPFS